MTKQQHTITVTSNPHGATVLVHSSATRTTRRAAWVEPCHPLKRAVWRALRAVPGDICAPLCRRDAWGPWRINWCSWVAAQAKGNAARVIRRQRRARYRTRKLATEIEDRTITALIREGYVKNATD